MQQWERMLFDRLWSEAIRAIEEQVAGLDHLRTRAVGVASFASAILGVGASQIAKDFNPVAVGAGVVALISYVMLIWRCRRALLPTSDLYLAAAPKLEDQVRDSVGSMEHGDDERVALRRMAAEMDAMRVWNDNQLLPQYDAVRSALTLLAVESTATAVLLAAQAGGT